MRLGAPHAARPPLKGQGTAAGKVRATRGRAPGHKAESSDGGQRRFCVCPSQLIPDIQTEGHYIIKSLILCVFGRFQYIVNTNSFMLN